MPDKDANVAFESVEASLDRLLAYLNNAHSRASEILPFESPSTADVIRPEPRGAIAYVRECLESAEHLVQRIDAIHGHIGRL